MEPIHVALARRAPRIRMLLLILSALIFVHAVRTIFEPDATVQSIFFGVLVAWFSFSQFLIPRRYEIYPDRLRVVLIVSRLDIMFGSIDEVLRGKWWHTNVYWGLRFATVAHRVIEIKRKDAGLRRPNLVISPLDHEVFMARLEEARSAFGGPLPAATAQPA